MKGFEPVTLRWKGESYTVEADEQLEFVVTIEDALTRGYGGNAVAMLLQPGGPSSGRLARAYGAALRYAGADVSDLEVLASINADLADEETDALLKVNSAIIGLLSIISPPVALSVIGNSSGKKQPPETPTDS